MATSENLPSWGNRKPGQEREDRAIVPKFLIRHPGATLLIG
jgi:hypothetical protein